MSASEMGFGVHANVVLYPGVEVGDRTRLHANCVIHERTQIGADCVIHSGAVIGAEGFGFVPHGYRLAQNAPIRSHDPRRSGRSGLVIAPSIDQRWVRPGLARAPKLITWSKLAMAVKWVPTARWQGRWASLVEFNSGPGVVLAGQVGIADQIQVGAGAIATAKTGITQDVAAKAMVSSNVPAMPNRQWLRIVALLRQLPDLARHTAVSSTAFGFLGATTSALESGLDLLW